MRSPGAFVFSKLDAGEYLFQADYKGLHMNHSNPLLQVGGEHDTLDISVVAGAEDISIETAMVRIVDRMMNGTPKVYPVRVGEQLIIDLGNDNPGLNVEIISIIDLNGKVIFKWDSPVWIGSQTEIDFSHFKPGIYFLRIQRKDTCLYLQIIKN